MSIYRPPHYLASQEEFVRFVAAYPLGTLIGPGEYISHMPVIRSDEGILIGHLARANPHVLQLDNQVIRCIFLGPQGYISPRWYVGSSEVPTWNYAAFHIQARVTVDRTTAGVLLAVQQLTAAFEGESGWKVDEKAQKGLLGAIVAIRLHIETIEGKYKLSQNKNPIDRARVVAQLERSERASDRDLAWWMHENGLE